MLNNGKPLQSFFRTDTEYQPVSIDFDRTPGMALNELGKIDFKLFQSQLIRTAVKMFTKINKQLDSRLQLAVAALGVTSVSGVCVRMGQKEPLSAHGNQFGKASIHLTGETALS